MVKFLNLTEKYISQLSDWEILSVYKYINFVLNKKNKSAEIEFDCISFLFFSKNVFKTIESLNNVKILYKNEYSKRHNN